MTIFSYDLTLFDCAVIYCVAMFAGMAKTGVHGAGMAVIPMVASVFGGKASSGLLLPILCIADVFAVVYYHRHASWAHLKKLFPWAAAGVMLGAAVGHFINDSAFRMIMAITVVVSVVIMVWLERAKREDVPDYVWFAILMGIAAGFTSMIGNLAGSVMAVYLLSMRLPKNSYIGTTAWFFLFVNLFKVPFHMVAWHTITLNSFLLDLTTIPAIGLGAVAGVFIVRNIPEKIYRWFIIVMTLITALVMILNS